MDSKGNHRKVVIAQNKPKPKKIETDIQKIQRIEQELAKLDMENMLKYIDPSLHSSKNLFNEILSINDLVLKEISINVKALILEADPQSGIRAG